MSNPNVGWLFYKKMYSFLDNNTRPDNSKKHDEYDPYNRWLNETTMEVLNSKFYNYPYHRGKYDFKLETIYPGLLIGVGYAHNAKNREDNFDFGFFFDHTTGMPVISGSSVKGVLRSIFKRLKNELEQESIIAFFKDILNRYNIEGILSDDKESIIKTLQEIEYNIFEGKGSTSLYNTDKFFDAYILAGDEKSLIFADDYITPHANPLKEPVPNRMLKVRAGVSFEFSFDLYDVLLSNGVLLTKENKKLIFLELIQFTGVGAKTNVGYGQFEKSIEFLPITEEENTPDDKIFDFKEFSENICNVKTGKSIKSMLKSMKKIHILEDEERTILVKIINNSIATKYTLPIDFESLSNKKKRAIIGDYIDVLILLK